MEDLFTLQDIRVARDTDVYFDKIFYAENVRFKGYLKYYLECLEF